MVKPHGGRLTNRILTRNQLDQVEGEVTEFDQLPIDKETFIEVENIAIGTFSPLEGFMNQDDFESVLKINRLTSDLAWTVPITLTVDEKQAIPLEKGNQVVLTYQGEPIALFDLEDKFSPDKHQWAKAVYGTSDIKHPGVAGIYAKKNILLGGSINLLKRPTVSFPQYHLTPKETRVLFKAKGWKTIVGFQTRNAPHIGHEYVQKAALTFVDGLFINPVIGKKKQGDFKDEVIIKSYQALIDYYYLQARAVLVTLLIEMRYAGPKEAIFHAIIRKNYGCTHFIVGRDHAGVGDYYSPFAAQDIFEEFPDIGIIPLFFRSFSYCTKCGSVVNEKICPHTSEYHINFSGTQIRKDLMEGKRPPKEQMRPEVADIILQHEHPIVE